jgi:WD40 repeat protein
VSTSDREPPSDTLPPQLSVPVSSPTFTSDVNSLLLNLQLGVNAVRPAADAPPPLIRGYEVFEELGRGGMGVVYRAREIEVNREVALKMILPSASADPAEVQRFVSEAAAIATVSHDNVVRLFHLGAAEGRPFFSMEYVKGESLAARLKREKKLEPRAAARLLAAVCDGLHAAHTAGTIHRDVKPGNILIPTAPNDPPKVSDFGLAKRLASDLTHTQAVMGTPEYMAPEQAVGHAKFVGPGADVYSAGAVLYACVTGRVPLEVKDVLELQRKLESERPVSPDRVERGVPRDLALVCLKCLEKDARDRYETAHELAEDLRRFLRGEPVRARPVGLVARAARWARRDPVRALAALAAAVAAVAVPALSVRAYDRYERRVAAADAAATLADSERRARDAAERLARVQELNGLLTDFRNRESARPPGWTERTRSDLPRAVELLATDPGRRAELRGAAARAVLSADLIPMDPVQDGFTAAALATHPLTGELIAGVHIGFNALEVRFFDAETGALARRAVLAAEPRGNIVIDRSPDHTRALAVSPCGRWLFAGTRYGRVVRLDLHAPAPPRTWRVGDTAVNRLAVSPDGATVFAVCGALRAWDHARDAERPIDGAGVEALAVLPTGAVLASGGGRLAQLAPDGSTARAADAPGGSAVAVAGPGLILRGDDRRLEYVDPPALAPVDALTDPALRRRAHERPIRHIAVHPDGAYAATSGEDADRFVRVWELASCRLVASVPVPGNGPIALAWSGDGRVLCATADKHLARWRFVAPRAVRFACTCAHHLDAAVPLADGRVAALGEGEGTRALLVGAPAAPAELVRVPNPSGDGLPGLSAAPGGGLLGTLDANGLLLWKPGAPVPALAQPKASHRHPRVAPDGTVWAVTSAHTVTAYDPKVGRKLGSWSNAIEAKFSGLSSLDALAVGPAGAVAGGRNGTLYHLDTACNLRTTYARRGDPVLSVALSPCGALVAAGTQQGRVRLVRLGENRELPDLDAHPSGTTAVAFDLTGTVFASGGRDRSVKLWARDGDRFELILTVANLSSAVRELHFAPDSQRLLVLLTDEHAARVCDVAVLRRELGEVGLGW